MGVDWPATGPVKDTDLTIIESPKGVSLGFQNGTLPAEPMQLAMGSDRFAYTFINVQNSNSIKELRLSYYPPSHAWLPTPGQEESPADSLGRTYNEDISRHCLGCHVTALPTNTVTPEPKFYGVGCESCHGAGKKHVDAVRAGAKDGLHMVRMSTLGATKLNEACGKCHRNTSDVPPDQCCQ